MGLLQLFQRAPAPAAKFADGRVGYAVGDIHGRADLLTPLLDLIEARAEEDRRGGVEPVIIFLGDYVDRGPNSAGVIDILLTERPRGFQRRYLKGNHEQAMLAYLERALENRAWVLQGGAETMRSYGVTPPPLGAADADWLIAAETLRAHLPEQHLSFLNNLERYVVYGDYAFVHAGIDASRTLEQQTDTDLFWSRSQFINSKRRFSHRIVHGHTPVDRPFVDERRIAVDTGAYASGVLTAARFEGEEVSFLSVSDRDRRA